MQVIIINLIFGAYGSFFVVCFGNDVRVFVPVGDYGGYASAFY